MVVLLSQTKDILDPCVLIPRCSKHDPLMVNLVQEHAREARSFLIGRAVRRKKSFPGRPNTASIILLRSSLKGPSISLMYKEKRDEYCRIWCCGHWSRRCCGSATTRRRRCW